METYKFNMDISIFIDEIGDKAFKIAKRMGWNPRITGGELVFECPIEDADMVDFIFMDYL